MHVCIYVCYLHFHEKNPAFSSADLVNNVHRPKSPSSRCTTINRYIYSLKSIAEIEDLKKLPLRKSVIRAHLQVIPRLLKSYPVTVNITTTARLLSHDISQFVVAGRDRISVTADSNGWIELNVTEGLKTLLPLALSTNTSDDLNIEFLVTQQVDCTKTKKVPAAFVEPTSIKLSQEKRRERHLPLQALLLIYATDEDIVKDQHVIAQSEEEENQKQKRSASRACHRESYQIRFSELQLNYILAPAMYNAYRCVGGCTHQQLSANSRLATNHALLMASAKFVSDLPNSNIAFPRRPRDPLCSPTRYESLPILISIANDMVDIEHYPSMKVTECGCR